MSTPNSWYETVNGEELQQGDILLEIPLIELSENYPWPIQKQEAPKDGITIHAVDGIIMSQSCDLAHPNKLKYVAFCLVFLLDDLPQFYDKRRREELRKGRLVAYHLLNECSIPPHKQGFMIVDFKRIFSVPLALTRRLAREQPDRLRLKPPYKEHLAQGFARYFMRVGLPQDIPPFK